jgi:CubicO group peptidase (beta-lactamase class C family)
MRGTIQRGVCGVLALSATVAIATRLAAQAALPPAMRSGIDSAVTGVLSRTGAPSASIAVVRDGAVTYARAYGSARLDPKTPATPDMRYSIGSISKQFTATAVLLLAQRGQLSLDDKVSKWLPLLTRAGNVSLRQLLSMTSGYQDYWPQDYVMPGMLQPTTAQQIVTAWAGKPLDFEPGTKWQYSNTNYVIAGMIVEQVSGLPLVDFLRKEIFAPLHMQSVAIIDEGPLGPSDPQGYLRYALGPPRPAPKEGKGWLFAAGELAMTAFDLAQWDISVINQTVLKPVFYHEQQTTTLLTDGTATGYGLGVNVGVMDGHRMISHGGEVSGFTAQNRIYPDDRTAVVVLVNLDASGAAGQIAGGISRLLFAVTDSQAPQATARVRAIFEGLQRGRIDRTQFSANANFYFSDQALADFASSLGPLGQVAEVTELGQSLRGGMVYRAFRIRCAQGTVTVSTFTLPDGKLEQFQVAGG